MGDEIVKVDFEAVPFAEALGALRRGDEAAWATATEKLTGQVSQALQRRFGASARRAVSYSQAAQSAFGTVFHRLQAGEFHLECWADLAGLLIVVAFRKCLRMVVKNQRTVSWPQNGEAFIEASDDHNLEFEEMLGELREAIKLLEKELSPEEKNLLQLLLDGELFEFGQKKALAARLGCSTRTLDRRRAALIQKIRKKLFPESD